jgi:hypothetical protein
VSLAGTWYALWETTAEGRLSIDSEAVTVRQTGLDHCIENHSRAPENPLGSFLWRTHCQVASGLSVIACDRGVARMQMSKSLPAAADLLGVTPDPGERS